MANENYFIELNKLAGETDKLRVAGKELTYISWPVAWEMLKKQYPNANYEVHCNPSGMPYFKDESGAFVKVSVQVGMNAHTVFLPILDNTNRASKTPDSFLINKAIQRALTKAMAMHGIGLYAYKGEDYPDEHEKVEKPAKPQQNAPNAAPAPEGEKKFNDGQSHCFGCDKVISQKVAEYSNNKFGENLCMSCQTKGKV